jgi:hypothetical protein
MGVKQVKETDNWWDDSSFQDKLVTLLINDHQTLRNCAALLSPDDFKPIAGVPNGRARWLVAERALEYYEKHQEPLGSLVRADVLEYATQINMGAMQTNELREYIKELALIKPTSPDALVHKVINYKSYLLKKTVLEEMSELQSQNELTDEKWQEFSNKVLNVNSLATAETINYTQTLETRIARRLTDTKRVRSPWTFIDPLDSILHRTVGPGQLGLILAPYKRGKSSMLLWLASALAYQRYNVLFITLEDTKDVVEDRLDSIISAIPLKSLTGKPKTLRRKFERYKNFVQAQIEIYDGTSGGVTIQIIERIISTCRNKGFIPNALIVDYDEEIEPSKGFKEKRFETDEVYRGLRRLCAKHHLVGWTAAQTQRNTRGLKIITGDKVAEDIGKAKKVTCCISMGQGDWTDESIYLWVAASKIDRMNIGVTIIPDMERSLVYDGEATSRVAKQQAHGNP